MNNIIDFLCFADSDIELLSDDVDTVNGIRELHVIKKLSPVFCPICSYRMHSKGIRIRKVRHPIFQDGYKLIINVHERRWSCANENCNGYYVDEFTFIEKGKQISNITPLLILENLRELTRTAVSVANQFHVSDSYVHNIVLTYLDFKPLKMPRVLSIDEVYLEFNRNNRYCLVLMDFETGDIVDVLPNRNKDTLEDYFLHIDRKERDGVEVIITDMYKPYLNFSKKYFHNAKNVVDSFHVKSFLIRSINRYIDIVQKKYQNIDNKRREEKNLNNNKSYKTIKESDEVKLLKNYRFFLLKNKDEIDYSDYRYFRKRFAAYYNTYELEKQFMALDDKFEKIRDLKELYTEFNSDYFGKPIDQIRNRLDELIKLYDESDIYIFKDFSNHLKDFKDEIIESFIDYGVTYKEKEREELHRRLSNGPMEGFNKKPKDLKRTSRGFDNFEYTRNRILWSERKDAHVLAVPKDLKDVQTKTNIKRGHYNKHQQ